MKSKTLLSTALVICAASGSTVLAQQPTASPRCTTVRPGPDWVCADGNWLPPGMPIRDSRSAAPAPAPAGASCTTPQPGTGWVCVGDGWFPPGMPLPQGQQQSAAPPPSSVPSGACTTPQPGEGWRCAAGGWYPPGMPLPGGAAAAPAPAAPAAGCTTPQPGSGWRCASGNWYPPGMAVPGGEPAPSPSTQTSTPPAPSPSPTPSAPEPARSATGGRLRVMTWNVHFGHGDTWGQARVIADSGADVVLLQEASTFDEHMPSTYPEKLQQLTGQRWYSVWAPHGGRYSNNEGTLILSRQPLAAQSTMNAHERGFARAVVNVGGVNVTILNAHLDWDTGRRSSQLEAFLAWGRDMGGPRIAGGDFNSWWGEWWIKQTENDYRDTWQEVTGSDEGGYTLNRAVRFDYLFRSYDEQWRLVPNDCRVIRTSLSDHDAVIAEYTVR